MLLRRVREVCSGPIVLMKGPEVGARYPDPALRPCKDLDLLGREPDGVQRALRAAGFLPTGTPHLYEGIHHLRPLYLPGLPVTIEVHARPKWPTHMTAPPAAELIEAAVPSVARRPRPADVAGRPPRRLARGPRAGRTIRWPARAA